MTGWEELAARLPLDSGAEVDLAALAEVLPELSALRGTEQDPIFHAEGDVWIHTQLVLEALLAAPGWSALPLAERQQLCLAALLHDIAKPHCTRREYLGGRTHKGRAGGAVVEGACDDTVRVRSPGHARKGALLTRELLFRAGAPFAIREAVCGLIAEHALPLVLLRKEQADGKKRLFAASYRTSLEGLARLAEADVRGRECPDQGELLDEIALFREHCAEHGVATGPRAFPSDHSRVLYFRKVGRDPDYRAHEEHRGEVIVLSGLPGSGKDTTISERFDHLPVISLDGLRRELGVAPAGHQGAVIDAARQRARQLLRGGESFVWNATNLTRDLRRRIIDLALDYRFESRVVYVEVPWEQLLARNAQRRGDEQLPRRALARLIARWELPDATEAHRVELAVATHENR